MSTERKLDIFRVLKALDEKDVEFYASLTTEEQKAFQPFLVMRWLSGTYSKQQVFLINELVNPYAFDFREHKELLWYLLTICTSGKSQRYVWNKSSATTPTASNAIQAIQEYYQYSRRDAERALKILTQDNVIQIAEELGWQDDEINKIRKEFGLPLTKIPKPRKKTVKVTDLDSIEF